MSAATYVATKVAGYLFLPKLVDFELDGELAQQAHTFDEAEDASELIAIELTEGGGSVHIEDPGVAEALVLLLIGGLALGAVWIYTRTGRSR